MVQGDAYSIDVEITVILAALAMLIKPIRNKLVGQYFNLAN